MIKFFAILFRQNIMFEWLHSLPTQSLLLGNLDRVGFGLQKKSLFINKKKHTLFCPWYTVIPDIKNVPATYIPG